MGPLALPLLNLAGKVFDKLFPDPAKAAEAKLKLMEMQQAGELAYLDADTKLALAQAGINAEEAKSTNWFVAGWRPAVGWTCVAGLIYQFIAYPLFTWASLNFGWTPPPVLDTGILVTMLGGLLGLGGLRTVEKIKDVARS